jgi:hypothetical protein
VLRRFSWHGWMVQRQIHSARWWQGKVAVAEERKQSRGRLRGGGKKGEEFSACPRATIRPTMACGAAAKRWVTASRGGGCGLDDGLGMIGMGTDERAPPGLRILIFQN